MDNEHLINHKKVLPTFISRYCKTNLLRPANILKVGESDCVSYLQLKLPDCSITEHILGQGRVTPDIHWDVVFAPDILNYQESHSQLKYAVNALKVFTEISNVFVNYLPYNRKLGLTPKQLRLRINDMTDLRAEEVYRLETAHYNTGKEKKMTTYVWELKR